MSKYISRDINTNTFETNAVESKVKLYDIYCRRWQWHCHTGIIILYNIKPCLNKHYETSEELLNLIAFEFASVKLSIFEK